MQDNEHRDDFADCTIDNLGETPQSTDGWHTDRPLPARPETTYTDFTGFPLPLQTTKTRRCEKKLAKKTLRKAYQKQHEEIVVQNAKYLLVLADRVAITVPSATGLINAIIASYSSSTAKGITDLK